MAGSAKTLAGGGGDTGVWEGVSGRERVGTRGKRLLAASGCAGAEGGGGWTWETSCGCRRHGHPTLRRGGVLQLGRGLRADTVPLCHIP